MKTSTLITAVVVAISIAGGVWYFLNSRSSSESADSIASNELKINVTIQNKQGGSEEETPARFSPTLLWGMKLVNENVSDEDLNKLAQIGVKVIEGEWGMDEAAP